MRGASVSITVPEQVYNDLRAMDDDEKRRLREEYPNLTVSHNYVELWMFDQLVDAYGEELYDIDGNATVAASGEIVEAEEQARDDDGNFL